MLVVIIGTTLGTVAGVVAVHYLRLALRRWVRR